MRLKIGDHVHSIVRRSDHAFDVDGVRVQARVSPAGAPRFEGRTESGRRSVFVVRDGDRVTAQIDGRCYNLTVLSRAALESSEHATVQGALEAPMPGRVTRVAVAVGDVVKRGQELVVVEAMKMENALIAPSDGIVTSLAVKVGDMAAPGHLLIVIEEPS